MAYLAIYAVFTHCPTTRPPRVEKFGGKHGKSRFLYHPISLCAEMCPHAPFVGARLRVLRLLIFCRIRQLYPLSYLLQFGPPQLLSTCDISTLLICNHLWGLALNAIALSSRSAFTWLCIFFRYFYYSFMEVGAPYVFGVCAILYSAIPNIHISGLYRYSLSPLLIVGAPSCIVGIPLFWS